MRFNPSSGEGCPASFQSWRDRPYWQAAESRARRSAFGVHLGPAAPLGQAEKPDEQILFGAGRFLDRQPVVGEEGRADHDLEARKYLARLVIPDWRNALHGWLSGSLSKATRLPGAGKGTNVAVAKA